MTLVDAPAPSATPGAIRIQTRATLISAGTERMLVEFSQASLLQKARSQPDKVKQVLQKIKTDGLAPTLEAVFRKLDEPLPLGYCNAGKVMETTGPRTTGLRGGGPEGGGQKPEVRGAWADFQAGDRVVSNGPHAEIVSVPRNLCAKIPDGVSDEEAAFAVLGAIALQGIRLAKPTLGERFMVFGLGLIGLLTGQLLRANGCEVLAVDLNPDRLKLAEQFGARPVNVGMGADPVAAAEAWTGGVGVDGVIITASAKTDEIVHQAAEACRKRGRIVLVGVVGLNLRRDDFYKKELTFQVSCSYGPGRYDEKYEQGGQDYPLPYVRWTEQRNFEAVLGAMKCGALNVKSLITHRFNLDQAVAAYETIQKDHTALGVILQYPEAVDPSTKVRIASETKVEASGTAPRASQTVVGVIGAGNFAKAILMPALARTSARLEWVVDLAPPAASHLARKFGFAQAGTDYKTMLADSKVNAVFVVTSHNTHARFVCEALAAGKHVFVEKPLAMNEEELAAIKSKIANRKSQILMVGFNRRFSPHTAKVKELLLGRTEPLCMSMTVNAGAIPADNWIQDPKRGGGRIIGEACHFIDLLAHIAGAPVVSVSAMMVGEGPVVRTDKMSIQLSFADGSVGTVNYFANGSKSYPKEVLEVFSQGRIARLENFRVTTAYGFKGFSRFKTWRQDKGHLSEIAAFAERVASGGHSLIPFAELENVTRASFAAMDSASVGRVIAVG
jgi:predicted dehydrogenase/threonine dehydrogenase-like Zn-dependent dehydrogenase